MPSLIIVHNIVVFIIRDWYNIMNLVRLMNTLDIRILNDSIAMIFFFGKHADLQVWMYVCSEVSEISAQYNRLELFKGKNEW